MPNTGNQQNIENFVNEIAEKMTKKMELDRYWSDGSELNNAGSPVIEAAVSVAANMAIEAAKQYFKKTGDTAST